MLAEYLSVEQKASVVIFKNVLPVEYIKDLSQEPPLIWVLIATGKKGSKIADITWCKTQLKELIEKYVDSMLKLTNEAVTWKFSKNPENERMRILWYILYKIHIQV